MMTPRRVMLITAPVETIALDCLRASAPDFSIEHLPAPVTVVSDDVWRQIEILYTTNILPAPEQAPALRWIQLYSAGADTVLRHPLFETPVIFTTTSGVHAIPIAESVFGAILSWARRLAWVRECQAHRHWPPEEEQPALFMPEELWGKTIGIVGYGSIGRQVARLAAGFGMHVVALHRGADHRDRGFVFQGVGDPEGVLPERYYPLTRLGDLLGESDVVVIALPHTPTTRGLFDERAFRSMKRSALLVNIARGQICDEPALVHALREGWIGSAALDVFEQEPLPADHPLWTLPNVLISPHIAGLSARYPERAGLIFAENLRRYLAEESLFNVVSKEHRY